MDRINCSDDCVDQANHAIDFSLDDSNVSLDSITNLGDDCLNKVPSTFSDGLDCIPSLAPVSCKISNCSDNKTNCNGHAACGDCCFNSSSRCSSASGNPSSNHLCKVDCGFNSSGCETVKVSADRSNENCANDNCNCLGDEFVFLEPVNNILDGEHQLFKDRNQSHSDVLCNIFRTSLERLHLARECLCLSSSLTTNGICQALHDFLSSR